MFAPRVFEVGGLTPVQVQAGAGYAQPIARLQARRVVDARRRASSPRSAASTSEQFAAPGSTPTTRASRARFVAALVGNLEPTFYTLLGAVSFVLLIACANVASLFLGRLTARHKEIAVRQSLGATRVQVVQQFLIESLAFSCVAGDARTILLALWALSGHPVDRRVAAAAEHDADAELARARLHRRDHAGDARCSSASRRRCTRRARA